MRAVVQRVLEAEVKLVPSTGSGQALSKVEGINGQSIGQIGKGVLVYLSVGKTDTEKDVEWIAEKIVNMRIFQDEAGKMNRSLLDVGGGILLVSNFTLHGDCRKGRRPGFDASAEPQLAQQLYEKVIEMISQQGVAVEKGVFGEYMQVSSINDGPVTFLLDSIKLF
jgi:D-tyrosyl-tRNA(Tyr) deacylase